MDIDITVRCAVADPEALIAGQRRKFVEGGYDQGQADKLVTSVEGALMRIVAIHERLPKRGPGFEITEVACIDHDDPGEARVTSAMLEAGGRVYDYDERFEFQEDALKRIYQEMEYARRLEEAQEFLRLRG